MAVELTEAQVELAATLETCLNTLFGEGAFEAFIAAQIGTDAIQTCIKQAVIDCLTNPDTSPLTKEFLGAVFQNLPPEEFAENIADEDSSVTNSSGVGILTISTSISKTLLGGG